MPHSLFKITPSRAAAWVAVAIAAMVLASGTAAAQETDSTQQELQEIRLQLEALRAELHNLSQDTLKDHLSVYGELVDGNGTGYGEAALRNDMILYENQVALLENLTAARELQNAEHKAMYDRMAQPPAVGWSIYALGALMVACTVANIYVTRRSQPDWSAYYDDEGDSNAEVDAPTRAKPARVAQAPTPPPVDVESDDLGFELDGDAPPTPKASALAATQKASGFLKGLVPGAREARERDRAKKELAARHQINPQSIRECYGEAPDPDARPCLEGGKACPFLADCCALNDVDPNEVLSVANPDKVHHLLKGRRKAAETERKEAERKDAARQKAASLPRFDADEDLEA